MNQPELPGTGLLGLPSVIEAVARVAHLVNKAYCESIGDFSQPDWSTAPVWQRESAINGVKFHVANPTATPQQSHENWLAEKIAAGWAWGPDKDPVKLEHPCIMPYDQLPQAQRTKDVLFRGVVHAMLIPYFPLRYPGLGAQQRSL